jgi:hypothetical protein
MDKETILKILSGSDTSDKENQLANLISQLASLDENKKIINPDEQIADLQRFNTNLRQKHQFKVGDIVRWKEGLKNKLIPDYKQPAIVVDVLQVTLYDEKAEVGSPYFREPLDFVLGIIIKGELLTFHYDSRRFELFEKDEEIFIV